MIKQVPSERLVTRKVSVSISPIYSERHMEIRCADWERIKRRLKQMSRPVPSLQLWYSTLYGIALTALFTLISYAVFSVQTPPWAMPLYGSILFFSVVSATILVWFNRKIKSGKSLDVKDILDEMEEIETEHEL